MNNPPEELCDECCTILNVPTIHIRRYPYKGECTYCGCRRKKLYLDIKSDEP